MDLTLVMWSQKAERDLDKNITKLKSLSQFSPDKVFQRKTVMALRDNQDTETLRQNHTL